MPISQPAGPTGKIELAQDGGTAIGAAHSERVGLWFGVIAVGLWSFGSSFIYLGARAIGTWHFVAIATLVAGALQLLSRKISEGELKSALWLPWQLWAGPLLCFVLYGLAWPTALVNSRPEQVGGVNLINYLRPVLTVLLSAWCVPGMRLTSRIVGATALALAGLVCGNIRALREFRVVGGAPESLLAQLLPYGLAITAAITWAVYSALLARWRAWAKHYVTSPVGFLSIAVVAAAVLLTSARPVGAFNARGLMFTIAYGVGPLAGGYLLWELALAKAKVQTLSILAATTPVLSTLLLCCVIRRIPGPELILATVLVGGAVVLSMKE